MNFVIFNSFESLENQDQFEADSSSVEGLEMLARKFMTVCLVWFTEDLPAAGCFGVIDQLPSAVNSQLKKNQNKN